MLFVSKRQTEYSIRSKHEEWRLLGCYAVWLW
jgi:hypothetical protein